MQPGIGFSLLKGCLCAISAFVISSSVTAPGGFSILIWVLVGGVLGAYSSMITPSNGWYRPPLEVPPSQAGTWSCIPPCSPVGMTRDAEAAANNHQDCLSQEYCVRLPGPTHDAGGDPPVVCLPTLLHVIDTAVFPKAGATGQQTPPGQDPLSLEECSRILSQSMRRMIERGRVPPEEQGCRVDP